MRKVEVIPAGASEKQTGELREAIRVALRSQARAMGWNALTIRRMAVAGQRLIDAKGDLEHGEFRSWLISEGIVGDDVGCVSFSTVRNWMKLGEFHALHPDDLEKAATVRQAYQLAGLIPEPDASRSSGSGRGGGMLDIIRTAVRLKESLTERLKAQPLNNWSREERLILRDRLQFYVDLYERLAEA